MSKQRRRHGDDFKARVALAAVKEQKTVNELAGQFGVHTSQVQEWKRRLLEGARELFADGRERKRRSEDEPDTAELFEQIGRLKMELEWLKKKLPASIDARRSLVDGDHAKLSVARQCELLGLPRSTWYYEVQPESAENLRLMRRIDKEYTAHPFYGSRQITAVLQREGRTVNRKRVRRLMRVMGLEAIYPKRRTSVPGGGHKIYPYLLRNLEIKRPNQVWSSDITYVPLRCGFLYLVAIMDWFSRYVLTWKLSNSLDEVFCVEALDEALAEARPEIFNTDQGVQFTGRAFTGVLESAGVAISMDGKGRALDNVFVERLWRSVKYEEVYLKDYEEVADCRKGLGGYFPFYNRERPHQHLDNCTPWEVYRGKPHWRRREAEPRIVMVRGG